jgi:ribosomal protein S18 acetylase RimI-like enzyme
VADSSAGWSIRRATIGEAEAALAISREVAKWLVDTGRRLWDVESFQLDFFRNAARAGELVLGFAGAYPVASMLLQNRDDLYWPADPRGEALYVHKLVVRRTAAGQRWPDRLIAWAQVEARNAGVRFLRLDTADREVLLTLYRRLGFRVVDEQPRVVNGLMMYRLEKPVAENG